MALDGVEIIVNGSGSYMELRKAFVAVELVRSLFDIGLFSNKNDKPSYETKLI